MYEYVKVIREPGGSIYKLYADMFESVKVTTHWDQAALYISCTLICMNLSRLLGNQVAVYISCILICMNLLRLLGDQVVLFF